MKTVCIIQARMGSTRLPGKVLLPLLDRTVLDWVVYRARQSRLLDTIVIATTTDPRDDALAEHCAQRGWACFRGSEEDVLDRYYQAATRHAAETVVRITSDCPLIDPAVLDCLLAAYAARAPRADYASNIAPVRTYPRGLDSEVFSYAALEQAWREDDSAWREHVTPYIYRSGRFALHNVTNPVDYSAHRWTLDTPQDWELIQRVFAHFGHGDFTWQDALQAFEDHPAWLTINQDVQQKPI